MYKNLLQDSGLKEGEALIYDLLLQYGSLSAYDILSKVKLKRGMVYKFLNDLEKRSLISKFSKNKKTYFKPESPIKILQTIENNINEAQSQKTSIESILPEMINAFKLQESRPIVTYYDGIPGIKKVFNDIYAPKSEHVYGCVDLEKSHKAVPDYVVKDLIPLRIKNKLKAISFVADSKQSRQLKKNDKESLRETTLLDKNIYPIPAEIDVYEDKVALLSFEKGNFAGVLIQNKDIAESLKSIFKLAFKKSD